MPIDLYHIPGSPPCHSVRLVAAAADIELNLKFVNLLENEHLKPEFLEMNPQHTVPTIDDDGFYLWESRAICIYLVEKYAKNDSLYPKDPKQRAIVNQRLYFDIGTIYSSFGQYFYPQLYFGSAPDPAKFEKCHEALDYLDNFLEGQKYVAGNQMTIADLVIASSVVCFTIIDFDISKHKNTCAWLERIQLEAPNYNDVMDEGIQNFKLYIDKGRKGLLTE